jgi:predicted dehydrogenase
MVSHNQKIKFAVVGCGHIGKRHAEMIQQNPESQLVALVDIQDKQKLNIDNYNVPFYFSIDELLNANAEVDVITIASPNGYHAEHALKALEAKKHIVVEKPMSLTKSDAEKVIYKALNVHRHVFAVMQNRYSPPSEWIKELIDKDVIGKVFMVQLNCFWNRDDRYYKSDSWHGKKDLDGGTLFTQFSHFIDIMYWLFGDIGNIVSRITDHNHQHLTEFEDSGVVTFDFVNGGTGTLNFSTSVWDKNLEAA